MQLLTNGKNIIELVKEITWSGDSKEVSRRLNFTMLQNDFDKYMPVVKLSEGSDIIFKDNAGKDLFGGVIRTIKKNTASKIITVLAYDLLFNVNKSEVSKIFDGTPEAITKNICNDLNIPIGDIAKTNIKVYYPCLGKSAYEAIMIAYTQAGYATGNVYILMMKNINKLNVIKKGQYSGVVLEGTYNLEDGEYTVTNENVVNKVVITDKEGNMLRTIEDISSMNKHGTIQKTYKTEDGKDANAEAKALFHGIDQSGTVIALGDVRAISGYSLAVQDNKSGLYGLFYIESDTHTFTDGKHEMTLTLAFENTMDEKELPSSKKG